MNSSALPRPLASVLFVCLISVAPTSPGFAQTGGTRPHEVAVRSGEVIATSLGTNSVTVLRPNDVNSPYVIDVQARTWGVGFAGDLAYVTMPGETAIAVFDFSATGEPEREVDISVPVGCTEILSDASGTFLYVANVGASVATEPSLEWTHSILKIATSTGQVVGTFITERQPRALALSPDGERLFVGTVQGALGKSGLGAQVSPGFGFTDPHDGGSILIHDTASGGITSRIPVGSPVRCLAVLSDAVYASSGTGQYRIYFTHVGEGVQSEDPGRGGRDIPNVISSMLVDSDHDPLERQDTIFHHRPGTEPPATIGSNGDLPAVIPERVVVRPESADVNFAAELWITHSASGTLGRAWIVPETGAIATSGTHSLTFPIVDHVRPVTFGYVLDELTIAYQIISPSDLIRTDREDTERFRSRPRGIAIDLAADLVYVVTEFRSDLVTFDATEHPFADSVPGAGAIVSLGSKIDQYDRADRGEGNFFTFGEGFDFRETASGNKVNTLSCGTCHVDGHIDGKVRVSIRSPQNMPIVAPGDDRVVTAVPSMRDSQSTEWIFFEGLRTVLDRLEVIPECQYCEKADFFLDTVAFAPSTSGSPHAPSGTLSAAAERGRAWFDSMNCSRCHSPRTTPFKRTNVETPDPPPPPPPPVDGAISTGPLNFGARFLSDPTQSFIADETAINELPGRDSLRNMTHVGTRLNDAIATLHPAENVFVAGINTPALAGVWDNRPYFHDGRYRTLTEALEHTWIQPGLGNRAARVWMSDSVPDNLFDNESFPVTQSDLPRLEVNGTEFTLDGTPVSIMEFGTHAHEAPVSGAVSVQEYLTEHVPEASAYDDLLAFLRSLSSEFDPYPETEPLPAIENLAIAPNGFDEVLLQWETPQLTVCRVNGVSAVSSATIDTLSLGTAHSLTLSLPGTGPWTFTVESAYRGRVGSASVQQPLMFVNHSDATGLSVPFGSGPYASAPLDFDDDGAEDLLISFEKFFASLNWNSGLFTEAPVFNNVALTQLHDGQLDNTRGIAVADFIGDGRVDVFIADADTTNPSNLLLAGSSTGLDSDESWRLDAAASLEATGASFGDFDGDGWLDLYVLSHPSGTGDLLMRLDPSDTTFADVTASEGLRTGMTNSTSVAWADVNLDGKMDLMVGWGAATGSNEQWSPLYINQGASAPVRFVDKADPTGSPSIDTIGHVQAMVFADITGDRRIDLIVATDEPSAQNTLLAYINDGTGTFALADSSLGIQSQLPLGDVAVTDFDGNGVLDILAVPKTPDDVLLLSGHGDTDYRVFYDRTTLAGLGSELARGITLADFNKDTDADIFLLREELSADPNPEDKRFFWSNSLVDAAFQPSTPKAITIGFARESGPNHHNTMGIGARVAVAVTKPGGTVLRSVQVADGGTGRGSQGSGRLVFGLAGASTAEITVRWPHGQSQVFDAASFTTFPHITLTDTSDPEIQSSTVTASYVPSSGYTTHTYSWKSTYPGGYPQVLVTTGNKPASCLVPLGGVNQLLLTASTSGVSITSEFVDGEWLHTVTWIAYCADSCTYTYYARNVVGGQVYSSTPKTLNVSVCADIIE